MPSLEKMDDFFNARASAYDSHMLMDLSLDDFYAEIAAQLSHLRGDERLLDLGCGTGLELGRLFAKYPALRVTGIDLSAGMLKLLESKYPQKNLRLLCGSYFDIAFGEGAYDCVLSTYSLHHFTPEQKSRLYQKIRDALLPGGLFLLGDYTAQTREEEASHLAEGLRLLSGSGLSAGDFHYDTPLAGETELLLLQKAGFVSVHIPREWDRTTIFAAIKG